MIDQAQLYDYLYPYVSGCCAFIRSEGYMVVEMDRLIMFSNDQSVMSWIKLPVETTVIFIAKVSDFYKCGKKDKEGNIVKDKFMKHCTFIGAYGVYIDITTRYHQFLDNIKYNEPEYEEDLNTLPNAADYSKIIAPHYISFSKNQKKYRILVCKALLPINKGDECKVSIYNLYNDDTRLVLYTINKKKLKTNLSIISRQFVNCSMG